MTVAEVVSKIAARGLNVVEQKQENGKLLLTVKRGDDVVVWPTLTVGKSGKITDTSVKSYHLKLDGMTEHEVVAVYGDQYMANAGRPSAAEKSILAMVAAAKAQPEQKAPEAQQQETPKPEEPQAKKAKKE